MIVEALNFRALDSDDEKPWAPTRPAPQLSDVATALLMGGDPKESAARRSRLARADQRAQREKEADAAAWAAGNELRRAYGSVKRALAKSDALLPPDRGEEPDWEDERLARSAWLQALYDGAPAGLISGHEPMARQTSGREVVSAMAEGTLRLGPLEPRHLAVIGILAGVIPKVPGRPRKKRKPKKEPKASTVGEVLRREANAYAHIRRRRRNEDSRTSG